MQVNRTEYKMLIHQQERLIAEKRLGAVMPRDLHSSAAGYEVRSLYFDTLSDRCFVEKEDGLLVHEKIRLRIYGTDDRVIKLECKRKVGTSQIKRTMLIDRPTMEALVHCDYSVLLKSSDPLAPYFYRKLSCGMFPKVIIQYQRLSFCLPTNNTRITFDSDVRATECCLDLFQEPLQAYPILPPDRVILEVKFNNFLFDYIKDALRCVQQPVTSFSKYCSGRMFYRHLI